MSIGIWKLVAISYQTFFCIILSWLTLSCQLSPDPSELHEITLMKLLYFYDPVACNCMHFYNFTTTDRATNSRLTTAVVWPITNKVASQFRSKVQVWLILHLFWLALGVANMTQGGRAYSFYVTLIPFTMAGISLLLVDVVYAGLFLADAKSTTTERSILKFIDNTSGNIDKVNTTLRDVIVEDDTTWIAVMLAYGSVRGVVQWVFNFWIVKDSYCDGLTNYHHLQNTKRKLCSKSPQYSHIQV